MDRSGGGGGGLRVEETDLREIFGDAFIAYRNAYGER